MRFMPSAGGGAVTDNVMVAHLRMNSLALTALKKAIAEIESMARERQGGSRAPH